MKIEIIKRIMSEKTITKKPILDKSQGRNWKNKRIVNTYLNEQHQELIYAGSK